MAPKIREANCGSRSWSRLLCVLFLCEKVSPRRSFTVAPTSIWEHNGQMEAEARLPVVLPFRCHCHLPLIWHYMTSWSSIHGQEGLIDANYTPATKLGGVYWIQPVCLSVCPSVCLSVCPLTFLCPPCSIYSSGWMLSIFGTNDQ